MKPVIAMPQMGNTLFHKYMKSKYVQSLGRAGAEVRWIELEDLDMAISEACACDGFLLPGGADIAPHHYGQEPTEKCGKPNIQRDRAEFPMLEAFLATGKPILCICRGAQLLNVYCGGTLHQDIKEIQKCRHSDFRTKNRGTHGVTPQPGTRLAGILGTEREFVNSLHHQAVDRCGEKLVVSAVSEDGFPEALELKDHPFCLGVQWHPEHMGKNPRQQKLFAAFIAACKGEHNG